MYPENAKFLKPGLTSDLDHLYNLEVCDSFMPVYAAGRVFCDTFMDNVICKAFHTPLVIDVVQQLLITPPRYLSQKRSFFYRIPVPRRMIVSLIV